MAGPGNRPFRLLASSVAVGSSGGITVLEGLGGALARPTGVSVRLAVPESLLTRLNACIPSEALIAVDVRSTMSRLRWEERELPRLARRHRVDVVLGMTNTLPVATSLGGARGVLLIQNIAPLLPEVRRMYGGRARARLETLRALTMRSVHRADVVFLFTQYGRDLVSSLAPRAHVVAIPPGGLPTATIPSGERAIEDHVIVLADLYRYKGIEQVIGAIADPRLRELRLIVAGATMEPDYEQSLRETAHREGVADRVSFVGRVDRPEVIRLLRSARCLVQASHVESLALPMLEALQLGVPVVSTDIPVARELCGDAAWYFAGGDLGALADLLVDLPASPPARVPAPLAWSRTADALVTELRAVRTISRSLPR
jgi:glycosyltransferase involved in cell wall biosynthesis